MKRTPAGWIVGLFLTLMLVMVSCAENRNAVKDSEVAGDSPRQLTGLNATAEDGQVSIVLEADQPIQYTAFELENPQRIVLDLTETDPNPNVQEIGLDDGLVQKITPIYFPESNDLRVEVGLKEEAEYDLNKDDPKKLHLTVFKKGTRPELDNPAPVVAMEPPTPQMDEKDAVGELKVTDVLFEKVSDDLSRLTIATEGGAPKYQVIHRKNINRLTVDIENALIPQEKEKKVEVNFENSPIQSYGSYQFRKRPVPKVKVIANLKEDTSYNSYVEGNRIVLDVGPGAFLTEAVTGLSEEEKKNMYQAVAEEKGTQAAPSGPVYTGSKISLDFQGIDIHHLLRLLAEVGGTNIITSDEVGGKVTVRLKDVPWDQALDSIIKANGLGKVEEGGIIRISTLGRIQEDSEKKAKGQRSTEETEELITRIFTINYEDVKNLSKNMTKLKSKRGQIDVNERAKSIIVKDIRKSIVQMEDLVRKLDKPTPQVLIEARIVEATHSAAKALGIQWGGQFNQTLEADFPHTIGLSGIAGGDTNTGIGGNVVNLPTDSPPAGAIGLTLGHVNGTVLLDARLQALEESKKGRIISRPKITTMDATEASIESGQEIPYQTTSSEGTKTEFKKASLQLIVTPRVTPDGYIHLKIEAHKDQPLPGTPPPISTKNAKTEVLVKDGETTVIGGLFEESDSKAERGIPLFSKIPGLSKLFSNESVSVNGSEILIFITPKVIT